MKSWRTICPTLIAIATSLASSGVFLPEAALSQERSTPVVANPLGDSSFSRAFAVTSFEDLTAYARLKAAHPYQPAPKAHEILSTLTYDEYQQIQFNHKKAIWRGSDQFWIEMFHPGFVQRDQIGLNVIEQGREKTVAFNRDYFQYPESMSSFDIPAETTFSGIRIAGRFPGNDDPQEILTFLGSSYFRCRSSDCVYGSSTRGLAVNIGTPGEEEFPVFREFWIVEPEEGVNELIVLAFMDSPSLTGAYEFRLHPQEKTAEIDVRSMIYFRSRPEKLGIAPVTSMWMWGDGLIPPPLDLRPSVHDADGLLVETTEGWTWRSLCRQSYPSVSRLNANEIRGFGLLQRDTRFEHFQDSFAQYDRRPSVWIEPQNQWPKGHMELLELPGSHEGIDNIGAYWVPELPKNLEQGLPIAYRIHYFHGDLKTKCRDYLAAIQNVQIHRDPDSKVRLSIEFKGQSLADLAAETAVHTQLQTIRGEVLHQEIVRRPNGRWTLELVIRPESDAPFEIQVCLKDANRKLTETWAYLCPIKPPPYQYPQVYTRVE
ncbi:glucan biosynthesis protein [Rubinisphaera margarita]|uniref:glucan biosynthesis protein n=1 Tax=Rubinisphaera margarita TaxID=2909586 RepID=UPI001EE9914D|nr:glucan biosynthesis protein [Rubinisphaera margarita]MCG6156894.1 glucan biosynthesis protein [Rubinisphaera margarita]